MSPPPAVSQFDIGSFRNGGGYDDAYWEGLIDSVRIYDCELTQTQIEDIYDSEMPDADGDGVQDQNDNCLDIANGASEAPNDQVDADEDGYGNACDPDYNDNGLTTTADYPAFLACFQNSTHTYDPDCDESDHNADGDVTTADYSTFLNHFQENTTADGSAPGPSGLWCAGTVPCP